MARLVGTALVSSTLVLSVAPAGAVEDVERERVAGNDRFETAAEIAATAFPAGATQVVVASGRGFADALAGAALGLPILLTEPGSLPDATAAAIDALGADEVIILGGTAAVSPAVEAELEEVADEVNRIAGDDRFETAAAISRTVPGDTGDARTAVIATGAEFADALAGGPVAVAGDAAGSFPILLVGDDVPAATASALEDLDIDATLILGGTGAVSAAVADELEEITGSAPLRLAGPNRYATAVAIAEHAIDELDFPADEVLLASGVAFADALAGGLLGGRTEAPMLLTPPTSLHADTEAFLELHADTIETLTVLGGTAAVSEATAGDAETASETAAEETETNETIAVAPAADVVQANATTRDYTASGLAGGVDIVLVRCSSIATDAQGKTVFTNSDGSTRADGTASSGSAPYLANTPSYISEVNGTARAASGPTAPENNDYAGSVAPVGGTVSFTVTGPSGAATASSCVVPVVFDDANSDNALNVPAAATPAAPSEPFGTGGSTTFGPGAAGSGPFGSKNVTNSIDAANTFEVCTISSTQTNPITGVQTEDVDDGDCATFTYDANDTFQVSSAPVDMATFELRLTRDDDVAGTYNATASGVSTFNLTDEAAVAPTNVIEEPNATTDTGTTISWTESTTITTDAYRVLRLVEPTNGCPASGAGATALAPLITDPSADEFDPTTRPSFTDTTAAADTAYCYYVQPIDDGDDGALSDAVEVETLAGPPAGAPIITVATANSPDNGTLSTGDDHQLVFNEAMAATTADGSYSVTSEDVPVPQTIACAGAGQNADCTLSADGTTLRIRMTGTFLIAPEYPLTVASATGMTDTSGIAVNVGGSTDRVLDLVLPRDDAGPFIQTADMTTDPGANGFETAGDVMDVTFSEAIFLDDADGVLTEADLQAILGTDVAYGVAGSVSATVVSGSTLRLTITSSLTEGILLGELLDGTANDVIEDGFGNDQVVNTAANPTLTA